MMSQKKKPNILILYGNYGGGHKRAAEALSESLQKEIPDANITVEDFLGQAFPVGDWFFRTLYLQTFYWAKSAYGWLYYKTKELPADATLFELFSYIGVWKLEKYLKELEPDIVISTFPALAGMLAKVKERRNIFFTLWCVMTDYTSHSQWLYKSVDQYFVANDEVRTQVLPAGINSHTILPTGIPVMPVFYKHRDRHDLLKKWNLNHEQPIALLSAGAFGVTDLEDICTKLIHSNPMAQFVVICGRNQKLYKRLLNIQEQGYENLRPLPYVKEMDELMQVADLFVTKPGGLSVSEALACELPMILLKSMPGQEMENAKYLAASDAAKFAENDQELIDIITVLINDPNALQAMRENIQSIRHTFSPADRIAQLAKKTFEAKHPAYTQELFLQPQRIGEVL